jgi:hypothetical protein
VPLGHILPFKVQAPVETTSDQRRRRVLESVGVDDVDDRCDHRIGLLLDALQHRLQPVFVYFDIAVQKYNDLAKTQKHQCWAKKEISINTNIASCFAGSEHSRPDQPLSTWCFGHGDNGQIFYAIGNELIVNII